MDCRRVAEAEVIERYLRGELHPSERLQFEIHYFGCDRCFEDLRVSFTLREELGQSVPDLEGPPTRRPGQR